MSAVHGSHEPIIAPEPATHRDGLEWWLHDLRTDLSSDPPGWLDADGTRDGFTPDPLYEITGQPAVDHDGVEHQSPAPDAAVRAATETAGRHRAKH
jgi:hypothetical protein